MSTSCKATNTRGEPCAASVGTGSEYCFWHDPAQAVARAAARKRGGYNRRRGGDPTFAEKMSGRQFRTLEDMVCLMEVAIRATLALENSVSRNRTLGYLAGQWARVFEVGELDEEMEGELEPLNKRLETLHQDMMVGGGRGGIKSSRTAAERPAGKLSLAVVEIRHKGDVEQCRVENLCQQQ